MGFFGNLRQGFGKAVGHVKQTFAKAKATVHHGFGKLLAAHTRIGEYAHAINHHLKTDFGQTGKDISDGVNNRIHTNGHPLHQIHQGYKAAGVHGRAMQSHFS